jgi:hypothetical protein
MEQSTSPDGSDAGNPPRGPARSGRLKILLTEGSSTSARTTIYGLGSRHTIDIMDPSAFCQCRFSRLVRRWYRCPSYSRDPKAYLAFLAKRLRSGDYDVLIPTHEQVYLLARVREAVQSVVGLALPAFDALDQVEGKASFVRLLDELQLEHPKTVIVRTRNELERVNDFPRYVKLSYSTAGQGVRMVRNRDQLAEAIQQLDRAGMLEGHAEILVQSPAVGEQADIIGVFQHGRLVASYCGRLRARGIGGAAAAEVSAWDPAAVGDLRRLGEHLRWHGAMGMDYFHDPATGRRSYIELNPRIGETVTSMLSGVNLCEQLVRVSLGQRVAPIPPPRPGVRTHQGFLLLASRAMDGATRRELIAEWRRARNRIEPYQNSQDEVTRPREDWLSVIPYSAVALLLLARPRAARWLIHSTVDNYCLPEDAARGIRGLDREELVRAFTSAL